MAEEQTTTSSELQHVATKVAVKITAEEKATLQHSDIMERLPCGKGAAEVDPSTAHIALVSLGHNCGPKLSFQHLGRGAETLPFDWCRTRLEAVEHFLKTDFAGFFDYVTKQPVPGIDDMVMYRNYYHSFWHDNPDDAGMKERYTRRINRFKGIDAKEKPVLFVRAAMAKAELRGAIEVLSDFKARFGQCAHLLVVIPSQTAVKGLICMEGTQQFFVYCLEAGAMTEHGYTAFAKPVKEALDWMVGRPAPIRTFDTLEQLEELIDEVNNGFAGLGGLPAFEPSLLSEEQMANVRKKQQELSLPLKSAEVRAYQVVSLGTTCMPKMAMTSLGLCRPIDHETMHEEDFPFDWLFVRAKGVMELIRSDFTDLLTGTTAVVCGGDGARQQVLHRGALHSFWCEDPKEDRVRKRYQHRISCFRKLHQATKPLLFVRLISGKDELNELEELLALLIGRFGPATCLLLILDGQTETEGAAVIQGHDNLMVHFLSSSAMESTPGQELPCCSPIRCALDWVEGKAIEARTFDGIHRVIGWATETPQYAVNGIPVFSDDAGGGL